MKYTFLFTALIVLSACGGQKNETVADAKPAANEPVANAAVTAAQQLFEKFNNHDWAGMAALYADTAEFKDPTLGTGIVKQTRQQTITKYTELQKMIPDVKDSVVAMYPSGNKHITVEFVSKGTGPDGKPFELPVCTVFTVENGKITKDFTYFDNF
jgi:ketosteroid isomerase-like protein